jgi:hypothetical protein
VAKVVALSLQSRGGFHYISICTMRGLYRSVGHLKPKWNESDRAKNMSSTMNTKNFDGKRKMSHNNSTEFFGELVTSAYTRRQALADGEQILIEGDLAEMARQLYKYPIFLTGSVHGLIERAVSNERHCNDWKGVLWDILWMSRRMGKDLDEQTRQFTVIITGAGRRKYHTFLIQCGPVDFDDPRPALTVMLPEEY